MEKHKHLREAKLRKADLDTDKRTIRLSFSSENPVLRQDDYGEPWLEVLSHSKSDVDLSRLNNKAPFLIDHKREREYHAGSINRAWIEKKRGHCEVRLSNREEMRGTVQDITDGILTNVSVGYFVTEKIEAGVEENDIPIFRCKWQPFEISALSIPADSDVGIGRSQNLINENLTMAKQTTNQDTNRAVNDFKAAEKQRRQEIRAEYAAFDTNEYDTMMNECLDDPEITVDQARKTTTWGC